MFGVVVGIVLIICVVGASIVVAVLVSAGGIIVGLVVLMVGWVVVGIAVSIGEMPPIPLIVLVPCPPPLKELKPSLLPLPRILVKSYSVPAVLGFILYLPVGS